MCRGVKCSTCSKQSWAGCGMHLPSVFQNVKFEDRCTCGYEASEWSAAVAKATSQADGPYPKANGGGACSST